MKNLYAINDVTSNLFYPPFPANNDAIAQRSVIESVMRGGTVKEFPDHFALVQIGVFNEETGYVEDCPNRVVITVSALLASYLRSKELNG